MGLQAFLAQQRPKFSAGGKYQRLSALYEATEGFLYTPGKVTAGLTHIRDAISLKRVMIIVCIAVLPALLAGVYNVGWQANQAITAGDGLSEGWRSLRGQLRRPGHDPASVWDNLALGLAYFLPVYLVTLAVGGFWEVLFAQLRGREISEGFLVTSLLFALILPPSIPLWQAALGISFGVVIAKEVFGGTGHNFVNPALAGRAFLYFAYPAQNSGDAVWVAVDAVSSATPLAVAVRAGQNISDSTVMAAIEASGVSWWDAFVGNLPGSTGETSALAILFGAAILLYTRVASWRIMLSGLIGMALLATLYNLLANDANPLLAIPAHWHLVLGGFAFGLVFMATDPVSAAHTPTGQWLYGLLIGVLAILIRVANPAYPEGVMLAILLGNVFAPLFDYFVIEANIKRRRLRHG
ncbi:MAG: NADH:ubiquinone reductase (Na(+)-transporting) subunit B [Desulfobulbaceae bacterium]|nr:NADH:ubiquinone reductase (Na(+)-transporting) subunit B [Desulfobulbaceae bacterium]